MKLNKKLLLNQFVLFLFTLLSLTSCKKQQEHVEYCDIDAIPMNNLIKSVIDEINENYYDTVTKEKLEEGAINGMLGRLDEHSIYITENDLNAFNKNARGSFLGIGIEILQVKDGIEVCSVIDESPAFVAGLQALDIITQINGKALHEMQMKEVISKLCSDVPSIVRLSIQRNKTENIEISIKKSVIQIPSVKIDFVSNIAFMKINYFNDSTVQCAKKALKQIQKTQSNGLIIDLRNNPGGVVQQAIDFCNLFLICRKIVEFKSRREDESRVVYADNIDLSEGLSIVVLIDKNTASGAELVAAALGENKRAILMGEKTYGKGSLQSILPIPGRGALKLTTSIFFTPNGNKINQNGVMPDIEISKNKDSDEDNVICRAVDLLQGLSALNKNI